MSTPPDLVAELSRWMDELARKWERFLVHDPQVPVPPERERAALERRLVELSRQEFRAAAEGFRVQQLLHRFATFNNLWQRQLRGREEARGAFPLAPPPAAPPSAASRFGTPPPNARARAPVLAAEDECERLHARYLEALRAAGVPAAVSLERFRDAVAAQRQALEGRGAVVEGFDIVHEGAQVRLRARVRRGRE